MVYCIATRAILHSRIFNLYIILNIKVTESVVNCQIPNPNNLHHYHEPSTLTGIGFA